MGELNEPKFLKCRLREAYLLFLLSENFANFIIIIFWSLENVSLIKLMFFWISFFCNRMIMFHKAREYC